MSGPSILQKIATSAAVATPAPVARQVRGLSDRAIAWLFVTPTILLLLAINIFPLIWTIQLSFTNYKANRAARGEKFIGLRNYERVLGDADIWILADDRTFSDLDDAAAGTTGLWPCLAAEQAIQRTLFLDHADPAADDAFTGSSWKFLAFSLSTPDWAF